jgi:hypothetical protein
MEKITEDQLKSLQEVVGSINNLQSQIGAIELQKHQLLHQASEFQLKLSEIQKDLEADYGSVTVNLQDGTISEEEKSS